MEDTVAPNYPGDDICSEQSGVALVALGNNILEFCEFRNKFRNIYVNLRSMIRDISFSVQDERGVNTPNQKVSQATQMVDQTGEIREVLKRKLNLIGVKKLIVRTLRKAYSGLQTDIIGLPLKVTLKLLEAWRVKICWVISA